MAYLHNVRGLGGSSAFVGGTVDTKATRLPELAGLLGIAPADYELPKTKEGNDKQAEG